MRGLGVCCRSGMIALLVVFASGVAVSCGAPARPSSRPATRMYDRSMAQLGMVELVVPDRARAEHAKRLLERIERAFVVAEAKRLEASGRALGLSASGEPTDEEIRAAFAAMDAAATTAFAEYVRMQLELRSVLTKHEFDRLVKVR